MPKKKSFFKFLSEHRKSRLSSQGQTEEDLKWKVAWTRPNTGWAGFQ